MGAWVLIALCPPPPNETVFVRRGGVMHDAAFDKRRQCWIGLCQGRAYDMNADPVEWWDRAAAASETRQEPAPIPEPEPKGQLKFQF